MPGGRPTITAKDLPSGWVDTCIELAKNGKGKTHMAKALGISRQHLYDLLKEDQEFIDSMELCFQEYEIWWDNVGQEGMFMGGKDNPFNGALWSFQMKNRFGWADKLESKNENSGTTVVIQKDDAAL